MILVLGILSTRAEPVINELLASNQTINPENSDFDDYSDWIELYNPGPGDYSLANHYLTDDLAQPFKWRIPEDAVIPANGYLLFWADGYDAGVGETHIRGYYPWGSTYVTRGYHTSFKLSAAGESVGLFRNETPPVERILVPLDAVWKYRDTGTHPGDDWMTLDYADDGWAQGPAELGYGEGDENTVVSYGGNSANKYPTTYFRYHFDILDPSQLGDIRFRVLVDDGAIIYLNGEEVARLRMPVSPVGYRDYSAEIGNENVYDVVEVPGSLFRSGDNVLAVEVHQHTASSSDISFNAELLVSEILGTPVHVDSVRFDAQTSDVSYGRKPDTPDTWVYFGEPTPDAVNATLPLTELEKSPEVIASLDSGFYFGPQTLFLEPATPAGTVRYSLDGSVPTSDSPTFNSGLVISKTTIVRARTFVPGFIPGPILTRSIFIDEPAGPMPVVSFVADPATLFDDRIGIYENDTPYPYKGREIPIRIEFFEADQSPGFAVSAGARIGGENIWRKAQKPFNVITRGKYGDDAINYQVFPGEAVGSFGKIRLRNGGDNWANAMLRDAMMPSILRGQTENDLSSYRPCLLFLNGEFWGIYNIRKSLEEDFFAREHYLAEGTYDLVQYAHNEAGKVVLMAEIGTTEFYEEFMEFFTSHDLADPQHYSVIKEWMDIDSFIDYVATNEFIVNTSWRHNRAFWSARSPGSKWQWHVPDLDRGFNKDKLAGSLIDEFQKDYPLFNALDDNSEFVNRLLQRYAVHLGSTFLPERIGDKLDILSTEVEGSIQRQIARWGPEGGIASVGDRQEQLDGIKQFAIDRSPVAARKMEKRLDLDRGMAKLSVHVSPASGGEVRIAGVPLAAEYTTAVDLFMDTPVELTAEPAPGFSFAGWSNGSKEVSIEITLSGARSITAIFQSAAETVLPGVISENTSLTAAGSPYTVNDNLVVAAGRTLTLGPGVWVRMPAGGSIYVYGSLQVNGTASEPIKITSRTGRPWGSLNFVEATGPSNLTHLTIRGATLSREDPLNLKSAVSSYNSVLLLDHLDIEAPLPVFCRYGSTILRNSRIQIQFSGDGINLKSGEGLVEGCTFIGNEAPDTDAIDFDAVVSGTIRDNRIYAFRGLNSDAIDIGEGCADLLVADNRIYNITDKGISVGQGSSVRIEGNLIVDCAMGVGVKDFGSTAVIDQNTFFGVNIGVASYEKNVGNGGGHATISNCIFSRSGNMPVYADSLSSISVSYSLSDTLFLPGSGNQLEDPLFTDAGSYDFSLRESSPAIDAGDPAHSRDSDGSIADMGAYYFFNTADYPYLVPNVVVVNEVMAHSHDAAPDWIELYNNSSSVMDLGGWFLSDDPDAPEKYRIADGTFIPGNGYLVLYEDLHFGAASTDPGALVPFALSENGDVVSIFGPGDGLRPDYTEKERFGASLTGISLGRYYKESTGTFNFVAMASATPGTANDKPLTGPVVISEIMYHPGNVEAEYIELVNVSPEAVSLFDDSVNEPWRITDGIFHVFSSLNPVTLQSGERLLLVRNKTVFLEEYSPPSEPRIIQWDSGALSNGGESIQLSRPGDIDNQGERQFIRVDRVNYSDADPWPTGPDGSGTSLTRMDERAYGNDVANWTESTPTPGQTGYQKWARDAHLPLESAYPSSDPDGDSLSNLVEYAVGTNPLEPGTRVSWELLTVPGGYQVSFFLPTGRADVAYAIQAKNNLDSGEWINLIEAGTRRPDAAGVLEFIDRTALHRRFYRLVILAPNHYESGPGLEACR